MKSIKTQYRRVKSGLILLCLYVGALSGALPAMAQLNENCTVSILNRTAQVKPDGSWVLPNVPANFGQVRARATCVENGITLSGQSDFFTIPVNGSVDVPEILLGAVDPIPESLTITAPTTTLTSQGATTQLAVTANFADGSTTDITAASAGTDYTVSNPAIATVNPNGLVTAVSSGTVLVSAMNEGALGLLQIVVVLSGDSDGDGIPDDVELANGLNPNNPVDALEDFDNDGLTNKEELIDIGTNFQVADTDGDGIPDGEEVVVGTDGFVTNPLLADTDGDGIRDKLEITTGSDPTDSASFNLAQALASIEVTPSSFVLTFNTIIGEASRQLNVTGNLIDGTTIDLTSTAKGTNYSSSDLFICNFGAPDGRVFAGNDGACTVTASNSGFSDTASVIVETFAPTALTSISIPGYANNVDVNDDDFAYVAAGSTGLQVVDVRNLDGVPNLPPDRIVGSLDTPGNANDVKVVGKLAYIADGPAGLQIIDITDPFNPVSVGSVDTPGEARDVAVSNGVAYVADGAPGLQIIDVSNPEAPSILGSVDTPGNARGVGVSENLAVVANESPSAVTIIDVTDPTNPQIVGSVAIPGQAKDLVVREDSLAYVAAFIGGFQIVDFSTPTSPQIVGGLPGSSPLGFVPRDAAVSSQFALAAEQLFPHAVPVVDISEPANPIFRDTLNFAPLGDFAGTGIALTQQFVYETAESFIVRTEKNGTVGTTRLFIGQYLAIEDTEGIPPTVSITSPAPGDTVIEGSTLPISVEATDDVTVVAVDFLVDGRVVSTDTTAPYQFSTTVPIGVSSLTLGATAIDLGSNIGDAQDVVVNVIPDPLTTAVGTVVDREGNPLARATVTCLEVSGLTNFDGTFSVPDLPTIRGDIRCRATFVTTEGETLRGTSAGGSPVPGGITDVGQIVIGALGSRGTDFWLAFQNYSLSNTAQLLILSDMTTAFTVTGPGFNVTGTASPATPGIVALPSSLEITTNEVIEDKGIHVVSDEEVSVLFFYPGGATNDIYLGIPTGALGTDYFAVGFQESLSARGFSATLGPSEFVIVATQDNTNVTHVPSCTSLSGTPAGIPVDLVLNQGQTYQYLCGNRGDVTGTRITSDEPIGVIAGNGCADVPETVAFCDILSEMMFPVASLYGTEFFTAPLPGAAADIIRILAAQDSTTVTVDDGATLDSFSLNSGEFDELSVEPAARITSDKPITVVQYAVGIRQAGIGDPFEMQIVPTTAFRDTYRLFTPSGFFQGTFAIIVAPNSAVPSVTLNGLTVTGFAPLPGGTHQFAVTPVPTGQSVVTAAEPIGAYGIGFRSFGSYGYPAGF